METKYAVITKFFDNGIVKVNGPFAFEGGEYRDEYIDRGNWDEYVDVFNSYKEARDFASESKNA